MERVAGEIPAATGGAILDGVYDLVAIREYRFDGFAEVYQRAALQFSAGATQVEQIYDANPEYFADTESPHRLMSVMASGNVLHFTVTCPDAAFIIDQAYDRGFSIQDGELWLFQPTLLEIYRARP